MLITLSDWFSGRSVRYTPLGLALGIVQSFWENEFARYDKRLMAEAVAPIQNKIGRILMAPLLRNILGQVKNRIEPRRIMDKGQIFLAKLPKGLLGDDKAALLGALLVSQFYSAAMSRADIPRAKRRDMILYADEFGIMSGKGLASMLAETRKYGLSVVLSTQNLALLDESVRNAALGNVGSIVAFRVGPDDAAVLEKAFGGDIKADTFVCLDNASVAVKFLSSGKEQVPFCGYTCPLPPPTRTDAERIVRRSRQHYARARAKIELKITKWTASRQRFGKGVFSRHRIHRYGKRRIPISGI